MEQPLPRIGTMKLDDTLRQIKQRDIPIPNVTTFLMVTSSSAGFAVVGNDIDTFVSLLIKFLRENHNI